MATKTYREKTNMDSKWWWWWWWCVALYVCNRNSENVSSLNAKAHEWYACVGFIHTRTLLAICQWPLIKPFQKRVRETENKDEEKEKQKMKADMWLFRVFRFFFLEQTALKCLSRKKKHHSKGWSQIKMRSAPDLVIWWCAQLSIFVHDNRGWAVHNESVDICRIIINEVLPHWRFDSESSAHKHQPFHYWHEGSKHTNRSHMWPCSLDNNLKWTKYFCSAIWWKKHRSKIFFRMVCIGGMQITSCCKYK